MWALTDRLEQNRAFWMCVNDFKGEAVGCDFLIYCFPLLFQIDVFAFLCLPAFMASSCVQRRGCSNKEPFNFTYIFECMKNSVWEMAFGMNRNSILKPAFSHMCAAHVRYEQKTKDREKSISNNSSAASKTNWHIKKRRGWYFTADSIFIILLEAFSEGRNNLAMLCAALTGLARRENPLNRSVLMSQVSHWAV